MKINVNGSHNRVAGRDYYESRIKPCPECEQRLIDPSTQRICNHCEQIRRDEATKGKVALCMVAMFALVPHVHRWLGEPPGPDGLFEAFLFSAGALLLLLLMFHILKQIWLSRD
ncbi:TPA: hypothetical protein L4942_003503 [Pseudomonas aeruginosa]|uniref:hypothetical protein n=1 Tax=Pseudomonas aeruginosa TaxID=287 RepID=UPI00111C298E|nr:hypothetical protein [Pseudomonas aeruginosa]NNB79140.1 hypothetical protein [Pseudomonas aeruginosa]HBN8473967.1 hypothetical protein [Pseudomonas aeruginosa]HBO7181204.1 hypothetical protein [Pseudomonas aeruginosa]HCE7623307.1 hypothetical protein [Pseudomonas aeruginosa]